eukprot:gene2520-5442_t
MLQLVKIQLLKECGNQLLSQCVHSTQCTLALPLTSRECVRACCASHKHLQHRSFAATLTIARPTAFSHFDCQLQISLNFAQYE